jgi:hypothetical protein
MVAPLPGETAISAKRAELAGKGGILGLLSNKKTSAIGLFASLGGLVYGCKCLPMPPPAIGLSPDSTTRQPGNVRAGLDHELVYKSCKYLVPG